MTYFESVGVNCQYGATNISKAVKAFKKSCEICTKTGKHIACDRCAIANTHKDIINILK